MSLSVSISTFPCLSPCASACASPICAQAGVSLRPAPAQRSYFGFRLKGPTARRRRFRQPFPFLSRHPPTPPRPPPPRSDHELRAAESGNSGFSLRNR